jgi:DNA-binding MarR family transcriptional regulator
MKSNALSRVLLLSSGGTTNVINRLTAREFTERHPDPTDRRSTWIHLTATGVDLAEDPVHASGAARAEVFSGVPTATLTSATIALRKVSAALPASGLPLPDAG